MDIISVVGKAYHKCFMKYVCPYVKNIYQVTLRKTFVIEIRNAIYWEVLWSFYSTLKYNPLASLKSTNKYL